MTAVPPTAGHEEYAHLAAGHAVHALEPDDERRFEAHLAGCDRCARELASFRDAAAEFGHAVALTPPPGLGEAILDAIGTPAPVRVLQRRPQRRVVRAVPWALAAAAAVAAVATFAVNSRLRSELDAGRVTVAGAEQVLHCEAVAGCDPVWLKGEGDATAVALVTGDRATLVLDGVAPNPVDRSVYVLWEQRGGRMVAAGTFDVPERGLTTIAGLTVTPGNRVLAVSLEPGRVAPPAPSTPVLVSA